MNHIEIELAMAHTFYAESIKQALKHIYYAKRRAEYASLIKKVPVWLISGISWIDLTKVIDDYCVELRMPNQDYFPPCYRWGDASHTIDKMEWQFDNETKVIKVQITQFEINPTSNVRYDDRINIPFDVFVTFMQASKPDYDTNTIYAGVIADVDRWHKANEEYINKMIEYEAEMFSVKLAVLKKDLMLTNNS